MTAIQIGQQYDSSLKNYSFTFEFQFLIFELAIGVLSFDVLF